MNILPEQLIPALTCSPTPLIVGHVTPDADCLGSMFALALGIEQAVGEKVNCALPEGSLSQRLRFLLDWAKPDIAPTEQYSQSKVIVACDTAKLRRINLPDHLNRELEEGRRIINIDHHDSNTGFGEINWVDDEAGSTAELIYRLFRAASWEITPVVASLLYVGIHADTVGFSLSSTSHRTLDAAANLVECGADVGEAGEKMLRAQSKNEFDLRRIVYDNTRLSTTGRIAFSTVSYHEMNSARCKPPDIDDQVEIPRSLNGARIALLFSEGHEGKIRINLRGKSDLGVLELAKQIGGGGHRSAAGAIMSGTIEDAVGKLIPMAEQYLDNLERQSAEG